MKNANSPSVSGANKRCSTTRKALKSGKKEDLSVAAALRPAGRPCQPILYLGARELEVGIIESPQGGARFTVYQPGFVITSREVMWSLRNGKSKEGKGRGKWK